MPQSFCKKGSRDGGCDGLTVLPLALEPLLLDSLEWAICSQQALR